MVSQGTEMDHVVHVGDYFGLGELCQVIEEDKQKMLKMEDSSILVSSTGDVAEYQGDTLGVFDRDGSPLWRQKDTAGRGAILYFNDMCNFGSVLDRRWTCCST